MSVKELVGGSFDPQCKEICDSDSLKKELLITFFPLLSMNSIDEGVDCSDLRN